MRFRDVLSFAAFGAILVFVVGYFAMLGLRVNPPSERTNLSMSVPDINGLVVGSNVLLRGVPVGKVTATSTTLDSASIDFYVEGSFRVPTDTEVRLENLSALGESYIGLMPRVQGGPALTDGQRIATEEIVNPPSVSELAASVTRAIDQLEPGALQRVIAESASALPDPSTTLPNLSRTSELLNNAVEDMDGRGAVLLSNFQTLLTNAEWVNPTLIALSPYVREVGRGMQDFYKHQPILVRRGEPENVSNLNNLVARIQRLLDERGADLKVIGEAFQPKLNMIAASLMNFDTGQILDNFLATVPADGTITLRVTP